MKKVFNYFYCEQRKKVLFSLLGIFIVFGIFGASTLSEIATFDTVSMAIKMLILAICCIYFVVDLIKKQFKVNIFGLILIAISLLILIFSKSTLFLFSAIFLCSFQKEDFGKIAKVSFVSLIVGFLIVVGLMVFGVIPDPVFTRGEEIRLALGFASSTVPQSIFLLIVLLSFYIKKTDIGYSTLAFYFIISALIYYVTDTRTGFYLCIALILFMIALKIFKNKDGVLKIFKNRAVKIILMCLPLISILAFGLLVFLFQYDIGFINTLNEFLSGRIELTYNMFKNAPITLFGGTYFTNDVLGNYIGVDNALFYYLFMHGIFGFLLVFVGYILLIYLALKEENYWLLLCVIICIINGFVEPYILDIKYSIYILFLSQLFVKSRKENDEEQEIESKKIEVENATLEN